MAARMNVVSETLIVKGRQVVLLSVTIIYYVILQNCK